MPMIAGRQPTNNGPLSTARPPRPVDLLLFPAFFAAGLAKTLYWLLVKDVDFWVHSRHGCEAPPEPASRNILN